MPFGDMRKEQQLDRKECFEQWIQLGTVAAVRRLLFAQNKVNLWGKPFTRVSIARAAWIYTAEYPEESFKYLKESNNPFGQTLTYEDWLNEVAYHLSTNVQDYAFRKIAKEHPEGTYLLRARKMREAKLAEQKRR